MTGFEDPAYFGELYADDYDDDAHMNADGDGTVAAGFLAGLIASKGGRGRALELAVGTGRVALALAAHGVDVSGIEGSDKMVAKLREKPGGQDIRIAVGDMTFIGKDDELPGPFDLAYLVFNTLFNVTDKDRQLALFSNVAKRLAPGGAFVLECFIPDPARFPWGGHVSPRSVDFDTAGIEVCKHNPAEQTLTYQRVRFTRGGVSLNPLAMRYCWPSELDLMAKLAGMTLAARYENWQKKPFDGDSRDHISVYRLP